MSLRERLREQASALTLLESDDKNAWGPVGFVLGAMYALLRAEELGYRGGCIDEASYREELRAIARALAVEEDVSKVSGKRRFRSTGLGLVPSSSARRSPEVSGKHRSGPTEETREGPWLAGFYFDSALQRLAAASERLGFKPNSGEEPECLRKIRQEVNKLKHDEPGLLTGREVSPGDATEAVETLVKRCQEKKVVADRLDVSPARAGSLAEPDVRAQRTATASATAAPPRWPRR